MSTSQKYIIVHDRVEIYKDFAINLLNYIMDFYLDKDTLSDDGDIKNHYTWCYNKVCDEFIKENINFKNNEKLKDYFYQFYYDQFYKRDTGKDTQAITYGFYEKFWRNIFEIDKQKNKNTINTLIELYNIFDESINKEKNILEIV
jgi:hypothetical protein